MEETNKGKDLVILMHYRQEYDHDNRVETTMKFTLNWEGLVLESLFNDHDTTVFGWLDMLEVDDDFARYKFVDQTLLSLEELLEEMRQENLRRPSYLGVKIIITVFENSNVIETEPEYYGSEDESHVEYVDYNTVAETDEPVFYLQDQDEFVEGENNIADESELEYFEDPEAMEIEEENEQVGNKTDKAAMITLSYRGVNFFRLEEVGSLAHGRSCPICVEEFGGEHDEDMSECKEDEEDVAILPCSHVLHTHCLVGWFLRGAHLPTCPLCRYHLRLLFI